MNNNETAIVIAFARLLGISGTDEEIINTFMQYYSDAQKSLKGNEVPKEVKKILKRRLKKQKNINIDIKSEDISEMMIFLGLFVLVGILMFFATK